MKYFLLIIILTTEFLYPQFDIRAGMGINFISTPSLRDYLNQNYRTGEEFSTFNSAISFSGETGYYFSESFAAGIEVAYVYNSFTSVSDIGKRELTYGLIMPSLTAYYVISGTGYNVKLGGGAGIRLANVEESSTFYSDSYDASGFGLLLKADGNTLLGGNLYANIGVDLRYDINGNLDITRYEKEVNLNAFSAGIRLGITYIF